MKNLDQKQIGLRIKSVRVLTGLNQEEFAQECDFNHTSIRNWEFGRVTPRESAILNLIKAFQKFSIQVSKDWIFYGSGEGPFLSSHITPVKFENNIFDKIIKDFQETAALTNQRTVDAIITDDKMSPFYLNGDWVLALIYPLESLLENKDILRAPYLVKTSDGAIVPRILLSDGSNWWFRTKHSHLVEPLTSNWVGKIVLKISKDIINAKY